MKFGGVAWTRYEDTPQREEDEAPDAGVLAEFFETVRQVHNDNGELLYLDANGAQTVQETPKPAMSKPVLMIRFHTRYDPKCTIPVRKATERDKRDFPRAWKAFQEGRSFTENGTSLDVLRDMDIMSKAFLHALNVFSIEQLAATPESLLMGNPELRNWVNKGRAHMALNGPKKGDNAELLARVKALEEELAAAKANNKPAKAAKQEGIAA